MLRTAASSHCAQEKTHFPTSNNVHLFVCWERKRSESGAGDVTHGCWSAALLHDSIGPFWLDESCPQGPSAGEAAVILQMLTLMDNNDVPKMISVLLMSGFSKGLIHFLKSECKVLIPS